jgi:diguanylate cyclase (GGDEF)-like protein
VPAVRPRGSRSVRAELSLLFRAIAAIVAVLVVCNAGPRLYLLLVVQPRVDALHTLQHQAATLYGAMVDEETGLRGYLATGSDVFLQPYEAALPEVTRATTAAAADVSGARLTRDYVALRVAQESWTTQWVTPAADATQAPAPAGVGMQTRDVQQLTAFLLRGKTLFDRYRQAFDTFEADLNAELRSADADQRDWLVWAGIVQFLMAGFVVVVTLAAHRRLRRLIARPVSSLAATVARLHDGDLAARVPDEPAPAELVALSRDVDAMAAQLQRHVRLASARAEEAHLYAERLGVVLAAAREIAGSLSLRYGLEAVTSAARNIGNDHVRVWLTEDGGEAAALAYDSDADRKGPMPTALAPNADGTVGSALRDATTVVTEPDPETGMEEIAVPMKLGSRIVGVLECRRYPRDDTAEVLEILEALAGHAAASLESARLHEQTKRASVTDPLTGLPNRREFDDDLQAEVRRAQRYDRPLSVLFVDLDHFKLLNDRYGHRAGDVALQAAAAALQRSLRETDRVYRIGGEELVIIAPETAAEQGRTLAERLRRAVATCAEDGAPQVTASFGVAALPHNAVDAVGLMRAADRALYAAKSRGRDCVVVADETMLAAADFTMPSPREDLPAADRR